MAEKAAISFFDLDQTLLSINTGLQFGLYLYRKGMIPRFTLVKLFIAYGCSLAGFCSIEDLHKKVGKLFFFGKKMGDFNKELEPFFDECWQKAHHPIGHTLLEEAKQRGERVVILSSAPDFLVAHAAARLGVDEWYGSRYVVSSEGVIEGINQVLEGREKAEYVKEIANRYHIPLEATSGYSDSHRDIPFLEAVGKAYAVTPDRKLKKEALKRSWQLLEFLE